MTTINRFLLIVRSKEPYVAWANTACGEGPKTSIEKSAAEPSAYLVRQQDFDADGSRSVRESWEAIFESELEAWCTDEAAWPANRSLAMFRE